jgi:hypothetical protein
MYYLNFARSLTLRPWQVVIARAAGCGNRGQLLTTLLFCLRFRRFFRGSASKDFLLPN